MSMVERLGSSSSSKLLRSVYIRGVAHSDLTRQIFANWSVLILSVPLFSLVGVIRYLMTSARPVIFFIKERTVSVHNSLLLLTPPTAENIFPWKKTHSQSLFVCNFNCGKMSYRTVAKKNYEKHTKCSSSATFVNSQLVSRLPVGISHAIFIYNFLQSWSLY